MDQLGTGRVVEGMTGRGLIQGNHRVEVEEPYDGLAWGEIRDDVANLDRMAITATVALAAP